jgi:hypothetical protein
LHHHPYHHGCTHPRNRDLDMKHVSFCGEIQWTQPINQMKSPQYPPCFSNNRLHSTDHVTECHNNEFSTVILNTT